MIARLLPIFSRRIRELERQNERLAADMQAVLDKEFGKLGCTRMNWDPVKGFEADFKSGIGGIVAAWAINALESYGAKSFITMDLFPPGGVALSLTIQRCGGETPAGRIMRLETELAAWRAKVGEGAE